MLRKNRLNDRVKPRVLLIDPCPVTRFGFRKVLGSSPLFLEDIVEAQCIADIPKLMETYRPTAIIMELTGVGESALDALRMIGICTQQLSIPVIVCTEVTHANLINMLINLGVNGVCMKHEPVEMLVQCMKNALSGSRWNSDAVNEMLSSKAQMISSLTEKELKVLEFIFDGKNVTATAKLMSRDIRTISSHKRNAMVKLGFKNDSEMFSNAKWMSRNGCYY